jgi:hypothetical protein
MSDVFKALFGGPSTLFENPIDRAGPRDMGPSAPRYKPARSRIEPRDPPVVRTGAGGPSRASMPSRRGQFEVPDRRTDGRTRARADAARA